MTKTSILDRIESGERARLIPVTSSRQKELAAVSVVLAIPNRELMCYHPVIK